MHRMRGNGVTMSGNYPAGVRGSNFSYPTCPDCRRPPNDGTGHTEDCAYTGLTDTEIEDSIQAEKADDRVHEQRIEAAEEAKEER